MDKSTIGLAVALGVAGAFTGAHAATVPSQSATDVLHVSSVAELLDPVPNATAALAALDAEPKQETAKSEGDVQVAWHHHHHHHHHHHFWHHHHHHHHYWHWHHHHHHHWY